MRKALRFLFNVVEIGGALLLAGLLAPIAGLLWLVCEAPGLAYRRLRAWAFR